MGKIACLFVLTFIVIILSSGYIYHNFFKEEPEMLEVLVDLSKNPEISMTNELSMFKPLMRFDTDEISYSFDDCEEIKKKRMKNAFDILSKETGAFIFYENDYDPMITIYCKDPKEEKRDTIFVAGEGGPNRILPLDLYPQIIGGSIYLYRGENTKECEYPVIELHELLHVFGFEHINDTKKVLYPYLDCNQRLTEDIISEIKKLYSEKAKADIFIEDLETFTDKKYLDFSITVTNRGLLIAENTTLRISSQESEIYSYSLGTVSPGVSQRISTKNVPIKPKNAKQLTFKITTNTEEYFSDNNLATIFIE